MQKMNAKEVATELMGLSYWQFIRKFNAGDYVDLPHFRTGCGKRPRYFFYREQVQEWILKRIAKIQRKAG